MESRDAANQRAERMESQLREMQRQLQESSRQARSDKPSFDDVRSKMGERLKGIDPEFHSYMQMLEEQALNANKAMESLREERLVESLKGKFEELSSKSSLDQTDKDLYFSKMDALYRAGKLRSAADVEQAFKTIHEPQAKRMEEQKRKWIEEYTKTKKADAAKPSGQPKGKAPPAMKPAELSKNPQEARQQLNKLIVNQLRAARES